MYFCQFSGFEPWPGHCVVFLGKTLYSHSASLHPGVQMGTGEFNAGGNPAMD